MPDASIPAWNSWVFAGLHGHVVALEQATGAEVWRTSLPSTGYNVSAIVVESGRLLCASGGHVFALDPTDGKIHWHNSMKGLGNGVVYLTTANSNSTEAMFSVLAQAERDRQAHAAAASSGGVVTH